MFIRLISRVTMLCRFNISLGNLLLVIQECSIAHLVLLSFLLSGTHCLSNYVSSGNNKFLLIGQLGIILASTHILG